MTDRIVDDPQPLPPDGGGRRPFRWLPWNRRDEPEDSSPAGRFRRRLYRAERAVQALCHRTEELLERIREVMGQMEDLMRRHPRFSAYAGRHVFTAVFVGLLPFLYWGLDFVTLAPIIEFLLVQTGLLPEGEAAPLGLRALGSFVWVVVGYTLGGYAGLCREQRRPLSPLWWAAASFYVLAMPSLASATNSLLDLRPLHGLGLTCMAAVGSILPILTGPVSNDAKDYLLFLLQYWRLRRRERALRRERTRLGFQAVRRFGSLLREAEEFRRLFGEVFTPQLDEVGRRVIHEFSNGRVRDEEASQPGQDRRPEARPDPVPGDGRAVPNDGAEEATREYEIRLREQEAALQDSILEPARGDDAFSVHLP